MEFLLIDHTGHQYSDFIGAYYGPVWSPTQDFLAYQAVPSGEDRLIIVDGMGSQIAVSQPLSPRLCMACGTMPGWNPDGTKVAVVVEVGESSLTPPDRVLCIAHMDGTVFQMSLSSYTSNIQQLIWLDDVHLLMQSETLKERVQWEGRYFLFDDEMKTVREITSTLELTSTLGLDGLGSSAAASQNTRLATTRLDRPATDKAKIRLCRSCLKYGVPNCDILAWTGFE